MKVLPIANCQLPIADFVFGHRATGWQRATAWQQATWNESVNIRLRQIGNRQSAIGNRQ